MPGKLAARLIFTLIRVWQPASIGSGEAKQGGATLVARFPGAAARHSVARSQIGNFYAGLTAILHAASTTRPTSGTVAH